MQLYSLSLEGSMPLIQYLKPDRHLYEFGVYTGKGMRVMVSEFNRIGKPLKAAVGFDSCEGLPEEAQGVWCHPDWPPGVFNAQEWHNTNSIEGVLEAYKVMWADLKPMPEVVVGWYKDTLNEETVKKYNLGPASFIHMDTDLYLSCREALDFLFKFNLMEPGTIIRYDDWNSTPEWTAGESRAHLEMQTKYDALFDRIAENVFVVK